MKEIPNISPERMAEIRERHKLLRPQLEAEMPAVRAEWKEYVNSLARVVGRHHSEIETYRVKHGSDSTADALDKVLSEFFANI